MRIRFTWVLLLALAFLTAWMLRDEWGRLIERWGQQTYQAQLDRPVSTSQSYVLVPEQWMTFDLPAIAQSLRILTNANFDAVELPEPPAPPERPGWRYAVQYQLLDSSGNVVDAGRYHFRTRLSQYADPVHGDSYPSFYADDALLPGITCGMRYPLERRAPKATRLRLRLVDADPSIVDASVRLYCHEKRLEYKLGRLWQRVSEPGRDKLAAASVYSPDLLTDQERRNLVRWRWLAVAPSGMEGRDYERRVLYTWDDLQGNEVGEPILPEGLLLERDQPGAVPLPEETESVQIHMVGMSTEPCSFPLRVAWYGRGPHARLEQAFEIRDEQGSVELNVGGGLLQLRAGEPSAVRVFARCRDQWQEVTPDPSYVRTYQVRPGEPLEYRIAHLEGEHTPLKIALRREATSEGAGEVQWELLDEQGTEVARGDLSIQAQYSGLDRTLGSVGSAVVSDPSVAFVDAPPRAARLRFSVRRGTALVYLASRPPSLQRTTFVPEDYYVYQRWEVGARRSWFPLKPESYKRLINEQRATGVHIQPHPPEDDPHLVAGHYDWEEFRPQGRWTARYLLEPADPFRPRSVEPSATTLDELVAGRDYEVTFRATPGHRLAAARLFYQARTADPSKVRIWVDDQPIKEHSLRALGGEIDMPSLPTDRPLKLRLDSSADCRWFLSHLERPLGPRFMRRFAQRLKPPVTTFAYRKESAGHELLALRCFPPARTTERFEIRVEIHREQQANERTLIAPDWTMSRRQFSIRAPTREAILISPSAAAVGVGETCLIPLGSDLPPGNYRIEVQCELSGGYAVLSRTTPGIFAQHTVFKENTAELLP